MKAHDLLTAILTELRNGLSGAEVREGFGTKAASWLITRPTVAGVVDKELTGAGGGWEAKLRLDVYLPRGSGAQELEAIMDAVAGAAKNQELLRSVEREAAGTDKATGTLTSSCILAYGTPESGGAKAGKTLTAIGESKPFWYAGKECAS